MATAGRDHSSELSPADRAAYDGILEVLREQHAIDFREYRQPTIVRRVQNRMISANVADFPSYLTKVRADPEEPQRLLERLTIKVSQFFRHPEAFRALEAALRERQGASSAPISIWSAGCARGEEPYSLAILLAEIGHPAAERPNIWASDIDPRALLWARRGKYVENDLHDVPPDWRRAHFTSAREHTTSFYQVRDHVRARVTFAVHDLAAGARAPRRFDVVCCRNTLIYFQAALQLRVQKRLLDSLLPGGLLCLGEAEWVHPELASRFHVVDRKGRIFKLRDGASSCG